MVYSTLETESSMALPTDCGRVTGKLECMPRASKPESSYEIGSNPSEPYSASFEQLCKSGLNTQICNGILNATIPMMVRAVELRRESNRLLLTTSLSKVYAMLSFQYRAANDSECSNDRRSP
jgi:hypothetical protein